MLSLDRNRLLRTAPLLAGEVVLGLAALAGITLYVDEPAYEFGIQIALLLALLFSALNVGQERRRTLPGAIIMALAFLLYGGRHVLGPIVWFMFPGEIGAHQDIILAGLVAWFLIAFASWQANRRNLIFMVVCGLAIFGLMGTINLGSEMLVAFAVFVCAAVFCWGYEQYLEMHERLSAAARPCPASWIDMAKGQLSVAVLVGLLTFTLGSLLGAGAYRVTPNFYANMASRNYGWNVSPRMQRLFNSFDTSFRIGGGPVNLPDTPVLQVHADRAALWRGMVYDYYDGHKWLRMPSPHQSLVEYPEGGYTLLYSAQPPVAGSTLNRQHIKILTEQGMLLAAAQPIWVNYRLAPDYAVLGGPRLPVPVTDGFGCLSLSGGSNIRVAEYDVVSREPSHNPDLLRNADADYSNTAFERYLQAPATSASLLKPLVDSLTANLGTPYDKVIALQRYIEKTCLYTLNARAVPAGAPDAVDWFLNHSQKGACDLFSSSLTVLCRIAGIPARMATGFDSGEWNHEQGAFIVKGGDAHAWTEVYFHGYGWVPFNPQATVNYDEESVTGLLASGHYRVALREAARGLLGALVVLALVAMALAALVDPLQFFRRFLRRSPQSLLARAATEYHALYTYLQKRSGLTLSAALTPQEAVAGIVAALPRGLRLDRRRLEALNERFYHLRYSADPEYAEIAAVRTEIAQLNRQVRRRR